MFPTMAPAWRRKLKEELDLRGISRKELTRAVGNQRGRSKNDRLVYDLLDGTDNPRIGTLEAVAKALGKPVIIDNRAGASGSIGTKAVAAAAPDGHTLLMVASSHTIAPATNNTLPYDTEHDFATVAMVSKNPLMFVVSKDTPANTQIGRAHV